MAIVEKFTMMSSTENLVPVLTWCQDCLALNLALKTYLTGECD